MKNMFKMMGIIAIVVIIGFLLTACNGDNNGDPILPGSITIDPNTDVFTGTKLTATYSGEEDVSYQWKKGSENVGTDSNEFTPLEAGSYTVTVSAPGFRSKTSAAVSVTVDPGPGQPAAGLYAKAWPITASDTPIASVTANDIAAAVTYVNENPGTEVDPILYTLLINQNVTSGALYLGSWELPDVEVTLTIIGIGGERNIQYNGNANESLFMIGSADWEFPSIGSLTLGDNITLIGINNGQNSLINVSKGTLTMKDGSKITGHNNSSEFGPVASAVNVAGTFIMDGGEISGNQSDRGGSGVSLADSGSAAGRFTMNGGIITGNKSLAFWGAGGVYIDWDCIFTMNGGTITGNFRVEDEVETPLDVRNNNGTFNNNGGTIGVADPAP